MERTVDISGRPRFVFQCVLVSILTAGSVVFVGATVSGLFDAAGVSLSFVSGLPAVVAGVVAWVATTVLFVQHLRRADGDLWGGVPREQYLGRFAGHGGLARHNWEKAVEQLSGDDE